MKESMAAIAAQEKVGGIRKFTVVSFVACLYIPTSYA